MTRAATDLPDNLATGLTADEVAQRVAAGQSNDVPTRASRSTGDIIRANVFTRINAILTVLLVIVLCTGSIINGVFGLLIIANSGIGIIQELRAKRTLDRLAIVGQARPVVRRGGTSGEVPGNEVVLDDVIELGPGDQIIVDGVVLEATSLEVDESLLTGEADPMPKQPGEQVLSGSFVVSGGGAYRATKVGKEAYAAKIAEEASRFTLVSSQLRSGIDKILKFITYLLVPAGLLIIYTQLFTTDDGVKDSVLGMVGALVPMVPEGLVLMTSLAFAVGVVRLGRRMCLVQELPAIETLARVDVVCADKTGTLTENGMRVADVVTFADEPVADVLAALAADDPRPNASVIALAEKFDVKPPWTITGVAPFSSARKWSGMSYGAQGDWVLGAPDVLLDPAHEAAVRAEELGSGGLRILLLAKAPMPVDELLDAPTVIVEPVALVVLEQRVRDDARDTLDYFASQSVGLKVISGDNAVSVAAVASSLGLGGDAVDARDIAEGTLDDAVSANTVFGRVRPDQKRAMVGALQAQGHTVAMTGDGVNDVLALKDADIGVAMGSGSSAARSVAQIVLLDNKFATLPHVVAEGRRVIGNIERVSTLFLTKTVYSVVLAIVVGVVGVGSAIFGYGALPFPFKPIHVTIAGWFTIGIPAFLLSLAPNIERARDGFVRRVMLRAIPSGVVVGVATLVTYALTYHSDHVRSPTAALITLIAAAVWVLAIVARPYQWWKVALIAVSALVYIAIFAVPYAQKRFELPPPTGSQLTLALVSAAVAIIALEIVRAVENRVST